VLQESCVFFPSHIGRWKSQIIEKIGICLFPGVRGSGGSGRCAVVGSPWLGPLTSLSRDLS
jgi:hypothetical protein